MIIVSISLALLALLGGMFLLAKTQKDNLNLFFRIVSYFIIVLSFLSIGCITIRGAVKMYSIRHTPPGEMRMMMGGGGRFSENRMWFHHGMRGEGHDMMDGRHEDGMGRDGRDGHDGHDGWRHDGYNRAMKDSVQHKD